MLVVDDPPARSGAHVRRFVENWDGHLLVDDDAARRACSQARVTIVGCVLRALTRRKQFGLAQANQGPKAEEAAPRIGQLDAFRSEDRRAPRTARTLLELDALYQ